MPSETHVEFNPELALTPGAPRAVDEGCTCPTLANGHGVGSGRRTSDGTPVYWIHDGCPLHAPPAASSPGEAR